MSPVQPVANVYYIIFAERTEPIEPSAPPASVIIDQQPYPPNVVSTTTTADVTVTETVCLIYWLLIVQHTYKCIEHSMQHTRHRERSCCEDTYCPGFIFCFVVPIPSPSPGTGSCECLPPTTACCEGGIGFASLGRLFRCGGDGDNPIFIIIMVVVLALMLFALLGILAFVFYRLVSYILLNHYVI